jgi:hypothetical protein
LKHSNNPDGLHFPGRQAPDIFLEAARHLGGNPELSVIRGGLSNIGDMLLGPAFREAEQQKPEQSPGTKINKERHLESSRMHPDKNERGILTWPLRKKSA